MRMQGHEPRQSIWSVRPALVGVYFGFFTLAMVVGTSLVVLHEVTVVTSDSAYDTWIGIMQGVGLVGLTSAILIFTLTEIVEYPMVMANWFRQQYLEPLKERQRKEWREQGLEEGREEGEREALARVRSEMLKRGIKLTKEDEEAIFKPNGHSE